MAQNILAPGRNYELDSTRVVASDTEPGRCVKLDGNERWALTASGDSGPNVERQLAIVTPNYTFGGDNDTIVKGRTRACVARIGTGQRARVRVSHNANLNAGDPVQYGSSGRLTNAASANTPQAFLDEDYRANSTDLFWVVGA